MHDYSEDMVFAMGKLTLWPGVVIQAESTVKTYDQGKGGNRF